MRFRPAHLGLWACLLVGWQPYAKAEDSNEVSQRAISCASASPHNETPTGPEVSISEVTFSGFIQMPIADQDAIVGTVKRKEHGTDIDGIVEQALERVRGGWQDRGYFRVEVRGEGEILSKSESEIWLALFVHVDEGAKYRLGGITFKNNKLIPDSAKLRELFPIRDREIFRRDKIAEGLENLRKVYGEYGHINYTGVPSTTFDDEKLAYLEIDVDEGKQFIVGSINVIGLNDADREKVLKEFALKPGQIYNSRLRQRFLAQVPPLLPCGCPDSEVLTMNEGTGSVEVYLDFRPCS